MAIYLKINQIKGSVTAKDYKDCIDVHAYRVRHFRHAAELSGRAGPRNIGPNKRSSVIFTKSADNASADLFGFYTKATNIPSMTFNHVVGDGTQCFQQVTFKDVQLDSHEMHATANGLIEQIEFSFMQQESRIMPLDAKGQTIAAKSVGYDFAKME